MKNAAYRPQRAKEEYETAVDMYIATEKDARCYSRSTVRFRNALGETWYLRLNMVLKYETEEKPMLLHMERMVSSVYCNWKAACCRRMSLR